MPQLRVFANTGHQYFHLPLEELLPDREETWLENFVFANRGGWRRWDAYTPWIRYRYAMVRGVPTLKLAIETNLGHPTRGITYDVDDDLYPNQPDEDEQVHPYSSYDEAKIEEDFGRDRVMPLVSLPNKDDREIPVDLSLYWALPGGRDPVDVDLVVDLGNTRTVALLLEAPDRSGQPSFGRRVRALRFLPRGNPFELAREDDETGAGADDELAIIDSFLLLHRPLYASMDPPLSEDKITDAWEPVRDSGGGMQFRRKRILPHTFMELSPALIGGGRAPEGAAKILAGVSLDHEARFSLSSPKRYVWDVEQVGYGGSTVWKQIPNDFDPIPPDFFDDLGGLIRVFMGPDGVDWDIDNPPDEERFLGLPFLDARPTFPRRDAVCWFALSILEMAHRQINAPVYLRTTGRDSLTRRLCSVRVTYPAGWTHEEREGYFAQWQRAINLFTLTRMERHRPVSLTEASQGGDRPVLAPEPLDEAVCSQIPILYSDIRMLWGDGRSWIDLYGNDGQCVVMNLDIGGGTTDLAIIEYRLVEGGGQDVGGRPMGGQTSITLKPRLLFRDGYRIAGDMLVKRVIERIVVPAWMEAAGKHIYADYPDAESWVRRLFKAPAHNDLAGVDPRASQKMMRIIRLVFIPLARAWLGQLINSPEGSGRTWEPVKISDHVDKTTVTDLNALVKRVVRILARGARQWDEEAFPMEDIYLKCDRRTLESCIDEVFGEMLTGLSELVGQFDCHLVFVSGKPSELPRLRDLISQTFPIMGQRIIPVKGFPVGSWYPFSTFEGGRIMDAKTCTVVGAALYQDMINGRLDGFSILSAESTGVSRNYYWGILHPAMSGDDFFKSSNLMFQPRDYPEARQGQEEISVEKDFDMVPLGCRIGRQLVRLEGVLPDPVYVLIWKPTEAELGRTVYAKIRLRWISELGKGERLELVSATPTGNDKHVDLSSVHLALNTLGEDSFWLDDPTLDIEPAATAVTA